MTRTALLAATILVTPLSAAAEPERLHAWTRMPFAFESEADRAAFEEAGTFARAPLAGVEGDAEGNLYVTTPRWLDRGVPATLSRVAADGTLEPFPSREAHDLASPDGIRNALGVFVDGAQRMWIVDLGWVAGEDAAPPGGQKLLAYDLTTGEEVVRFPIGPDLADPATSFLNDIHVDEATGTVFITDSGNRGGSPVPAGIIVYDIATNTARRVLDRHPSVQDDPDLWLKVDGREVFDGARLAVGINGITRAGDRIWWSVTTGDALHSIPEAMLRDPEAGEAELAAAVEGPLRIGGGSDGIAADPSGRLWITNLALNRVEVLEPGAAETRVLVEGPEFVWPDSLARDFAGGMLLSVNHLNSAFGGRLDYDGDDPNFAVWRIPADMAPTR